MQRAVELNLSDSEYLKLSILQSDVLRRFAPLQGEWDYSKVTTSDLKKMTLPERRRFVTYALYRLDQKISRKEFRDLEDLLNFIGKTKLKGVDSDLLLGQ